MRMRAAVLTVTLLLSAMGGWAATPEASPDASLPTFRVTTAEVHVTFTAVRGKNQPVSNLSLADFVVLRDGSPIDRIVSFEPYHEAPISALMLTDVSDSMLKGLPLERTAAEWLRSNSNPANDHVSFVDFGYEVERGSSPQSRRMTSLYDALIETLPRLAHNASGRQALILLTDGMDNYSYHSLSDVIDMAQRFDIAVYAITAHPGKKQYYRPDLLQMLCDETGGKYYDVRKPEALLNAIAEINDELRNGYELVFRPDAAGAGMHQLSIQPNQRGMRFFHRTAYFQPGTEELASAR